MYQNNLFNQGNHMQLEMQVHQAFLNSPEGKRAEQVFAQAKKDWWDKVNNPNPAQVESHDDKRIESLESKMDMILNSISQMNNGKQQNDKNKKS